MAPSARSPPSLLCSRQFVVDMAMLAEGLVMTDMHTAETAAACRATSLAGGFWDFEAEVEEGSAKELAHRRAMESRERHPFWAPDKVGEVTMKGAAEKCEVNTALAGPFVPRAYAQLVSSLHAVRISEMLTCTPYLPVGPPTPGRMGTSPQAALLPAGNSVVRHCRWDGESSVSERLFPSR